MRRSATAVVIALLIASPLPSQAQALSRSWTNYCYTGAFQACASVEVGLLNFLDPGGHSLTAITVKIANLEGTLGNTPWGIVGFRLTGLPANGFPSGSEYPFPTFEGSAHGVGLQPPFPVDFNPGIDPGPAGSFGSLWFWMPSPVPGLVTLNREVQLGDGAFAITGCDAVTYGAQPNGYLQTCGDGWVVYDFLRDGPMTSTEGLQVSITSRAGAEFACTFDVDCIAVVPEPTTVLLVATGVGMIGGRRLRRRGRAQG